MVGITSFVFLLIGFVFLVLVVAAIADWPFDLTNSNGPNDDGESDRRDSPDGGFPASAGGGFGGAFDAGAGSLFGGCDGGAAAMGGCDAGAAGGDGGC